MLGFHVLGVLIPHRHQFGGNRTEGGGREKGRDVLGFGALWLPPSFKACLPGSTYLSQEINLPIRDEEAAPVIRGRERADFERDRWANPMTGLLDDERKATPRSQG